MTELRKFFLATTFAAALPAMASMPQQGIIDFEATATPADFYFDNDGNLVVTPGTGDGKAIGSFYTADFGVTFDSKAFSFYAFLNSKNEYGQNVGNLPILPGNPPGSNEVVMAAFHISRTCLDTLNIDTFDSCTKLLPSISTVATITKPYVSIEFAYSADIYSNAYVNFGLKSATGELSLENRQLAANTYHCGVVDYWCEWNTVSYTVPVGSTLTFVEFGGAEERVFFDNIILTPIPEPSTYALTFIGLVGIGFLAVNAVQRGV